MRERVLVLGAGGFIGRHLVDALVRDGKQVVAVSRRATGVPAVDGVETVVAEPRATDDFRRLLERCDSVVHLASASTPGSTAGDPIAEMHGNLQPTLALLDALQRQPATPLVFVSSGGTLYADGAEGLANEDRLVSPRSYHGAGKASAELFIAAWARQSGGAAVALRPANVYGPGQAERDGFGIVPACFGKILRREPLVVWGDGSAVRDFLYIDDFIALCLAAIAAPAPGWRVVNAASGVGTSLNTLFDTLEAVAGQPLPRRYDATRTVDATHVVIDASRALALYGWSARTGLADGLARTWQWFATSRP